MGMVSKAKYSGAFEPSGSVVAKDGNKLKAVKEAPIKMNSLLASWKCFCRKKYTIEPIKIGRIDEITTATAKPK